MRASPQLPAMMPNSQGGTGMAAMAAMLQQQGYVVTGSDQNVYPPMSVYLAELGIEVRLLPAAYVRAYVKRNG